MKKILFVVLCMAILSATGCRKRYVSPLETPIMTLAPEDREYVLDFDQLNNDVIDTLQEKGMFEFVKDLDISGDNDKKEIVLKADITENVSEIAIEYFLTEATKAIVDAASTQDFRITMYTEEDFGNLFEKYAYKYKVTCGEEVIVDETIEIGDSVPFDPSLTLENVIG
ncbi:MAG: hypothetical protein J6I76_20480 [Oribacterium sp.]|nr:hypothetical protein [Oribacterium sp.]